MFILGRNTTPSWVLFDNGTVLIGDAAINAPDTGKNLIYDSKRIIGRQFDDEVVTNDRQKWSFEVVRERNSPFEGKAMIKIDEFGRNRLLSPEEVSAELLKGMKSYAETYLGGESVTNAVITVPAYFDTRQRKATEEAARLAGLNVLRLLTEPAAAAIALAMRNRQANRTILVYDLGGSTFDVSIGRITDGELKILGINGDTHLGGEDFDEMIVSDYIAKFEAEHRMTVSINNTSYTYEYSIDRDKFYKICGPSFLGTMGVVDGALNTANLEPDKINDILLVGGSTRIPWIKELIRQKFPNSQILQCVNPDEAVAIGAAILASQMDPNKPLPEESLPLNNDIPNIDNRRTYAASRTKLNMAGILSTSSNAGPTNEENEQTTSNPIGLENIVCIGIDLGTTYSCVAVMENGQPLAIPCDDNGQNTMPCIVAYCNDEIFVGSSALWCNTDSANMLYDSKRLIGWDFIYNLPVANQRQLWAFNVDTQNNSAGYILNMGESTSGFVRPEEVSSQILKNLKNFAEKYLKKPVTGVVVTIPVQFNEKQRAATKAAVEMAGLELKYLLKEPIASALAYNHRRRLGDSMCLVIDFGGGTLDISIVEIENEILKVKALIGDPYLGGQDIDVRIMNYFIEECNRQNLEYNIQDPNNLKLLRIASREAKEALANRESYDISPCVNNVDDSKASVTLTQAKLNQLCDDIFMKIMDIADRAMGMVNLTSDRIDHVVSISI
ncbi:hypothetical protein WR25_02721 [Diploscapter pachys]|uniref:Uncharacterized protein n=1 Tax=Diploscapter pachys TaxID=2018661 RepID=A0A2A2JQI0_9BILA|nr:hypothetical protein WR25_02721 [Diploscapter pachys]